MGATVLIFLFGLIKMALVELDNVSLSYPIFGANSQSLRHSMLRVATGGKLVADDKRVKVNALDSVNLSLKPGDRLGVIGHNGAGKSSLLKLIAGVYAVSSGQLTVEGQVGSLFDIVLGLEMDATGYENITIRGLILGLSARRIDKLKNEVESFTDMGDYLSMPVRTYSSGMIVRLGFALATLITPEIFLIDEVIGAGDQRFIQKAYQRVEQLIQQSQILIITSHDLAMLKKFTNKILWLVSGQIKYLGNDTSILDKYEFAPQDTAKKTVQES